MASERGIYVAVMLFNGWSIVQRRWLNGNGYRGHPFHYRNNVNDVEPDRNYDDQGEELHRLGDARITRYQEAYVARVIDTVNEFDNVLYEISNESAPEALAWHNHMIAFIHRHQAAKPKQHPVGFSTFVHRVPTHLESLLESDAEWIAPNNGVDDEYVRDPPAATGRKVSILDTDHLWGIGGNPTWVWKSFLRGHHVIFMDGYDGQAVGLGAPGSWDIRHATRSQIIQRALGRGRSEPGWDPNAPLWVAVRAAMGDVQGFARRMPLAKMVPRGGLASTGYCLAGAGHYLVFAPAGAEDVSVDLQGSAGGMIVETFHTQRGVIVRKERVEGGKPRTLGLIPDTDTAVYLHPAGED